MNISDTLIKFFDESVPLKEGAFEFTHGSGAYRDTYKITGVNLKGVEYLSKNGYRGLLDRDSNYSFYSATLRRTIREGTKFVMDLT